MPPLKVRPQLELPLHPQLPLPLHFLSLPLHPLLLPPLPPEWPGLQWQTPAPPASPCGGRQSPAAERRQRSVSNSNASTAAHQLLAALHPPQA